MTLTELIKDNFVYFDSYRQGVFYYTLKRAVGTGEYASDGVEIEEYEKYLFPILAEELGTGELKPLMRAITLMKWIRSAKEKGELIKLK